MLYEQGVSAPTIADWFGVRPATVYAWLNRFETATDLAAAARDATRPGRPAKLSNEDRQAFFALLDGPPTDVGIETDEWTSEIARDLLSSRFGVEYSRRHVRRLVDQANAGGR